MADGDGDSQTPQIRGQSDQAAPVTISPKEIGNCVEDVRRLLITEG